MAEKESKDIKIEKNWRKGKKSKSDEELQSKTPDTKK